jgi:hypothetical protein
MHEQTVPRKKFSPLKTAVADKAKIPLERVEKIFASAKIIEEIATHKAENLTINRLAFRGIKKAADLENGPFEFEWSNLGVGLWLILSDGENQIGKSSIIEVMLWALRGRTRGLRPEVRTWIQHVELEFAIGLDRYSVIFDDMNDIPVGELVRLTPAPSQVLTSFSNDDQFEAAMGDLMMRRFALQPIPMVNQRSEIATQILHNWSLYASSMFIEGVHKAILGDIVVGALWWRMLHLFVGMPYAGAHMALRSAVTLTALRLEQLKSTDQSVSYRSEIEALNSQLVAISAELEAATATMPFATDVNSLLESFRYEIMLRSSLEEEHAEALCRLDLATKEVNDARTVLRRLKDGIETKQVFAGLNPVCCPRCAKPFPSERIMFEQEGGNCAVCDRDTVTDDKELLEAALVDAQEHITSTTEFRATLSDSENELRIQLATVTKNVNLLSAEIEKMEKNVAEFQRLQDLRLEQARLYGAFQQLSALENVRTSNPEEDTLAEELRVLKIAERIAEERLKEGGEHLLSQIEAELVNVAGRVGFRGLEKVAIRGNGITLTVSGTASNFSVQTSGQRLRLRISLVIAMMRLAGISGQGHHPGLLFIDSPGAEELSEVDLGAMMAEIRAVCDDTPNLQIFVSSARGGSLKSVVDIKRQRWPKPDAAMF